MHADTLIIQLNYNLNVARMNCAGVSEAQSRLGAEQGGNCLNWVTGHITATRSKILMLLGTRPIWSRKDAEPYERGAEPLNDPDAGLPLEKIMADFEASQQSIIAGLKGLTDEQLAAPAPFSPGNNPEETVGTLLAGLLFHEAYHVGQTGILRRLIGLEGTIK